MHPPCSDPLYPRLGRTLMWLLNEGERSWYELFSALRSVPEGLVRQAVGWLERHRYALTLETGSVIASPAGLVWMSANATEGASPRSVRAIAPFLNARFGRWTVLSLSHAMNGDNRLWLCRCDCGAVRSVRPSGLKDGTSRSCGCTRSKFHAEQITQHGHCARRSQSTEYTTWRRMRRIARESDVPIHPPWLDFQTFLADVGPRRGDVFTRIDRRRGFVPGNVEWISFSERARRTHRRQKSAWMLELDGERLHLSEWASRLGMHPEGLRARFRRGWPLRRALTEPPRRR